MQIHGTDVVIFTIGSTMLLWRKLYEESDNPKAWLDEVVELSHGSAFIWRCTGDLSGDDWRFKHGVYWPRKARRRGLPNDPGYIGPPRGVCRVRPNARHGKWRAH